MKNKSAKAFKAIILLIKNPWLLNKILSDEERFKKYVIRKYDAQNGLPVVDLLDILPGFDETVNSYAFLHSNAFITDYALLRGLAKKFNDCNYFEIGTWRGESVANVAGIAKKCLTLNLPDEVMIRKGLPVNYIEQHRFYSKDLKNVTHIQADSNTYDFRQLKDKFNLVFIDGDHNFESVRNDTKNAFNLLADKNSMIVWHDYSYDPETIRWSVLAGILDGTPEEERQNLYYISNTLCALYTKEKFNTTTLTPHIKPNKTFSIRISAKKLSSMCGI